MKKFIEILTTAPVDYDYESMSYAVKPDVGFTVTTEGARKETIRLVLLDEEHSNYQRGRYSSGFYPSWTREEAQTEMNSNYPHIYIY